LLAGNASATIVYDAIDTPSASTTLTLLIDDLGNTGSGGALTASDTATLTITATNDGPTATITPAVYVVNENIPFFLQGTGLTVSDPDAGANPVRVTLNVDEGSLSVVAGLTGVSVTGLGTGNVTLDGTLSQINNLLAGNLGGLIIYLALDLPSGSALLTMTINDLGWSGNGGSLTAFDTAILTINPENDEPSATITPASYVVTENVPLVLHGTGLTVSDPDAGSNPVQISLSVGEGILTVSAGTTGVTVTGSGTPSVTLNGTLSQLNVLLAGSAGATMIYETLEAPSASTTLTLLITDLGNTGTGGARPASDTATLTITAVNDSPSATIVPASYVVTENVPLVLHGTGLTVSDPDASTNPVQVTLSVGEGTLTVSAGTTGVTVTGSGSSTVILDGTLSQLNALLAGAAGATMIYETLEAPSASTTLTLLITDLGNTGTGGARPASDTATLTITAVNDSPSATIVPASYVVTENVPLVLHGTGLTVSDPDAGSNPVQLSLSVGEGTLTVSVGTTGVVVAGSGSSTVILDGTLSQLNALLAGSASATIVYNTLEAPSASTTLTLLITDLSNTGTGGARTASDTATLGFQA
jgi:hypothetical protein